jgi:hypothetical protein
MKVFRKMDAACGTLVDHTDTEMMVINFQIVPKYFV